MAKEQWKKIGAISGLVTLSIIIVGMAWGGGSRITGAERDISSNKREAASDTKVVADNQAEDRTAIKEIAGLVKDLKDQHSDDVKELKQDANDAKLRDERQSTQYTAILSHMQQQTAHVKKTDESINGINLSVGKLQVKMDTLTKD